MAGRILAGHLSLDHWSNWDHRKASEACGSKLFQNDAVIFGLSVTDALIQEFTKSCLKAMQKLCQVFGIRSTLHLFFLPLNHIWILSL